MNVLPFREHAFDIVFLAATMHHRSQLMKTFRSIDRLLKPGGRLVIINELVGSSVKTKTISCTEKDVDVNEHIYWFWEYLAPIFRLKYNYELFPYIGTYNVFITGLNHILAKLFPERLLSQRMWKPLIYLQLLFFGGILNLIANKPEQ